MVEVVRGIAQQGLGFRPALRVGLILRAGLKPLVVQAFTLALCAVVLVLVVFMPVFEVAPVPCVVLAPLLFCPLFAFAVALSSKWFRAAARALMASRSWYDSYRRSIEASRARSLASISSCVSTRGAVRCPPSMVTEPSGLRVMVMPSPAIAGTTMHSDARAAISKGLIISTSMGLPNG